MASLLPLETHPSAFQPFLELFGLSHATLDSTWKFSAGMNTKREDIRALLVPLSPGPAPASDRDCLGQPVSGTSILASCFRFSLCFCSLDCRRALLELLYCLAASMAVAGEECARAQELSSTGISTS